MFSYENRSSRNKAEDEAVPHKFVKIVKCTLAKMVAAGYLNKDYINLDLWSNFPKKLSAAKAYLIGKKKKKVSFKIYIYCLLHFNYPLYIKGK